MHQQVPNVDFASLNYVNSMPHAASDESSDNNAKYVYDGPSQIVQQLTNQVAMTGSVSAIDAPYPNATWELSFPGPGLNCVDVPQSVRSRVQDKLMANLNTPDDECVTRGYLAWLGNSVELTGNVSLSYGNLTGSSVPLNFMVLPHMMQVDPSIGPTLGGGVIPYLYACNGQDATTAKGREKLFKDSLMMQCQLKNCTYHAAFDFVNGRQTVRMTTEMIDDGAVQPVDSVRGWGLAYPEYTRGGVDCTVLSGGIDHSDPCSVDQTTLRTLSYQAIFDAFQTLVVGSVSRADVAAGPSIDTGVNNTVLSETPDLQFLKTSSGPSSLAYQPLQQYIMASNRTIFDGLVKTKSSARAGPFSEAIQELFRNVTISMMSSNLLQ